MLTSVVEGVSFVLATTLELFVFDNFDEVEVFNLFEWVLIELLKFTLMMDYFGVHSEILWVSLL